jgi:hypothetical protein
MLVRNLRRKCSHAHDIVFAAAYLLFVVLVFIGLKYADPGWAEGGIPLVIVGLPWSIPVLLIDGAISFIPGIDKITVTEGANFFNFVILCGAGSTLH